MIIKGYVSRQIASVCTNLIELAAQPHWLDGNYCTLSFKCLKTLNNSQCRRIKSEPHRNQSDHHHIHQRVGIKWSPSAIWFIGGDRNPIYWKITSQKFENVIRQLLWIVVSYGKDVKLLQWILNENWVEKVPYIRTICIMGRTMEHLIYVVKDASGDGGSSCVGPGCWGCFVLYSEALTFPNN